MPTLKRRRRPGIEALEDRRVPASWGIPWADPQHLTASFVPDGTLAQGRSTQLYQTLDSQLGAGKWEATILRALQTWSANSNINIGLVADGGQPIGVTGPAQGDARFGDIRISAEPLAADVVAITSPYSPAYGTLSGDIILNSKDDFNPADPGSYDLYTVALHEAGHVFGFADSADPTSFMYDVYQGPQAGLAPGAIPALQALYGGPRSIDAIDGNPVSTNPAKPLNIPNPSKGSTTTVLAGDLASAQESDFFAFKAPKSTDAPLGMDVQVQASGISLLAPKVSVYDGSGNLVATASASGPFDGGASIHLGGLVEKQDYTIQVQGATGDVFSVGSYELTFGITNPAGSAPGNPTAGAKNIPEPGKYDGSTPLTVGTQISQDGQDDVYSFKTPKSTPNGATFNLQDWGIGLEAPGVTIYDAQGNVVGSAVAPNAASPSVNIHVAGIAPNATYFVAVANGAINATSFGTYQLAVSFAAPASGGSSSNFSLATPWFGSPGGNPPANTSLNAAAQLQTPQGEAPQSHYLAIQGIAPSQPQQFYKLQTPHVQPGQSEIMTVSVQALGTDGLLPWIGVFDQKGNPVNAQVLAEQDGVAVVQVALSPSSNQYTLEVSSAQVGGVQASGNYVLNATFGTTLAFIGPISSGTLAASPAGSPTAQVSTTLAIGQTELYSFVLDGAASNAGTDASLQMTLLDSSGNVVATLSTPASLAESMVVCLPSGNYTVLIGAYSPSGQPIPPLSYSLTGTNLSDPIKVFPMSGSGGGTTAR